MSGNSFFQQNDSSKSSEVFAPTTQDLTVPPVGEDDIVIVFHYVEKKNKAGKSVKNILSEQEAKKMLEDEKTKHLVIELKTVWKDLSWKENNQVYRESVYYNEEKGYDEIDQFTYREVQISRCLKWWDLKDKNGNIIPVNQQNIEKQKSGFMAKIVKRFDEMTSLEDEEIKKS